MAKIVDYPDSDTKDALRKLLLQSEAIRSKNQALIKEKLQWYRDISGKNAAYVMKESLGIVDKQSKLLRSIRSSLFDMISHNAIRDYHYLFKKNEYLSLDVENILQEVTPLLNSIISALFYQEKALTSGSDVFVKVSLYRKYFKEELDAYKKYSEFAKTIISEMSLLKEDIEDLQKFKTEKYYRQVLIEVLFIVLTLSFFLDPDTGKILSTVILMHSMFVLSDYTQATIKMEKILVAAKNIIR